MTTTGQTDRQTARELQCTCPNIRTGQRICTSQQDAANGRPRSPATVQPNAANLRNPSACLPMGPAALHLGLEGPGSVRACRPDWLKS
ncbi:hypothetical protein J1614_011908 [Plenodomus biglobosus]|nr:hypothetical protein J1614_011908 [Plenodomus biglobosus]